jgi:cytochrome c553
MNRAIASFLSIMFALSATVQAQAADSRESAQRLDAACAACHGAHGNQPVMPETPRLAGQEYAYLVDALTQYRSGARQNPLMGAMAKSLTDVQIHALARYFAAQRGLTVKY